ncbi:MAG: hypothetical protein ACREX0_07330 [Noviherbaspirillum sp.]
MHKAEYANTNWRGDIEQLCLSTHSHGVITRYLNVETEQCTHCAKRRKYKSESASLSSGKTFAAGRRAPRDAASRRVSDDEKVNLSTTNPYQ